MLRHLDEYLNKKIHFTLRDNLSSHRSRLPILRILIIHMLLNPVAVRTQELELLLPLRIIQDALVVLGLASPTPPVLSPIPMLVVNLKCASIGETAVKAFVTE